MSITSALRSFIVSTNPYWPFSKLNRMPYALALRRVVRAFRGHPEIRSIWIRNRQWVPAISDIDVTVLVRGGLSTGDECAFLQAFWREYGRLRRVFPMLGEVEILSEDELPAWLYYAACTPEPPRWELIYGEPVELRFNAAEPAWRERAVNFALWVYLDVIPPCFAVPDSNLRRRDIERRVRKIFKMLRPVIGEIGGGEQIADAAQVLERAVLALDSARGGASARSAEADRCTLKRAPRAVHEEISGVLRMQGGKMLIVVPDGLERESIARHAQDAAVVLPQCVFRYMLRTYNPYYFGSLAEKREVVEGSDVFLDVEAPPRDAFVRYTLERMVDVLTFARGEDLWSTAKPLKISNLERAMGRAMAIRMVVDDDGGWNFAQRREIENRWRARYPESALAFDEVLRDAAEGREAHARAGFFRLFQPLASGVLQQAQ